MLAVTRLLLCASFCGALAAAQLTQDSVLATIDGRPLTLSQHESVHLRINQRFIVNAWAMEEIPRQRLRAVGAAVPSPEVSPADPLDRRLVRIALLSRVAAEADPKGVAGRYQPCIDVGATARESGVLGSIVDTNHFETVATLRLDHARKLLEQTSLGRSLRERDKMAISVESVLVDRVNAARVSAHAVRARSLALRQGLSATGVRLRLEARGTSPAMEREFLRRWLKLEESGRIRVRPSAAKAMAARKGVDYDALSPREKLWWLRDCAYLATRAWLSEQRSKTRITFR